MKAVVVKESNNIVFEDVKEDNICEDEVKIKVKYTGICGSDVPRALNNGAHNYPIILGHEFSGVVVETGNKVKNVKINDHVVGIPLIPCLKCCDCQDGNYSLCKNYSFVGSRRQGSMAEYIVLKENNVFVIDKDIPLLEAAFFEPSTVAYHGIKLINMDNLENACIIGSGNIGLFVLQWLKILGVKNITVIGKNDSTMNKFLKYGANHCINTNDKNFEDIVLKTTNNKKFYNVFECAGSAETIKLSFNISANKGKISFIGTPKTPVNFTVKEWENINRKELTIVGSWMSYSKNFPGEEWIKTNEEFKKGKLIVPKEMIYGIYPMSSGKEAFGEFNKHVCGKIIIENEFF